MPLTFDENKKKARDERDKAIDKAIVQNKRRQFILEY